MGSWDKRRGSSVGQSHAAAGLVSQIDANAEEVGGTRRLATLAADTILGAWGRCDLTGLAAIPGHHLKNIERAVPDALGAADAGVVDLDGVGHALC